MVSVTSFQALTLTRRHHKLQYFTLFTDKLCSSVIKAYLLISLSTHPLKCRTDVEVERHRQGTDRHIDTYIVVV